MNKKSLSSIRDLFKTESFRLIGLLYMENEFFHLFILFIIYFYRFFFQNFLRVKLIQPDQYESFEFEAFKCSFSLTRVSCSRISELRKIYPQLAVG